MNEIYIIENSSRKKLLKKVNELVSNNQGILMGGINNYIKYGSTMGGTFSPRNIFYATIKKR